MSVSLQEAIMAVARPKGTLWYRDDTGTAICARPIAADETGVVFEDNTTRSLRLVSLSEDRVLHSV